MDMTRPLMILTIPLITACSKPPDVLSKQTNARSLPIAAVL